MNGDGKVDVILYNSATGTEYTGISNGSGGFTYQYQLWGAGKMLAKSVQPKLTAPQTLDLAHFIDCVGPNVNGYGPDCVLDSSGSPYTIDGVQQGTITITRSNITVEGAWPYPTILRGVGFNNPLIQTPSVSPGPCPTATELSGPCFVQIQHLIIDGNRGNVGPTCCAADLELPNCEYCFIYYTTFQNSSNQALYLHSDVPSAVGFSTFTNSYHSGIYTNTGVCPYPMYISPHVCQNIFENAFTASGGAGIGINSQNVQVVYNTFTGNGTICEDNAGAGQIGFSDSSNDNVVISYNTVNNAPTCPIGPWGGYANFGIEYHGTNATIFDNTIQGNSGAAIYMESAQHVTISTDNPSLWPMSNNNRENAGSDCAGGQPGIRIHTVSTSTSRLAEDITINNVWVVGGQTYGVQVDSCDSGSKKGPAMLLPLTITNNCFAGNQQAGNQGVFDHHNCTPGSSSQCIPAGATISNNQVVGCGGY